MLWYRSADVTTSRFASRQVFQAGTRLSETRDPNVISGRRFLQDLLAIVGKLLRKAGWRCVARGNSGAVRSFDGNGSMNTARRTDLYEGIADTIV